MKRREWIGSLTALAFSGLSAYANKKAEFLPKILLHLRQICPVHIFQNDALVLQHLF